MRDEAIVVIGILSSNSDGVRAPRPAERVPPQRSANVPTESAPRRPERSPRCAADEGLHGSAGGAALASRSILPGALGRSRRYNARCFQDAFQGRAGGLAARAAVGNFEHGLGAVAAPSTDHTNGEAPLLVGPRVEVITDPSGRETDFSARPHSAHVSLAPECRDQKLRRKRANRLEGLPVGHFGKTTRAARQVAALATRNGGLHDNPRSDHFRRTCSCGARSSREHQVPPQCGSGCGWRPTGRVRGARTDGRCARGRRTADRASVDRTCRRWRQRRGRLPPRGTAG